VIAQDLHISPGSPCTAEAYAFAMATPQQRRVLVVEDDETIARAVQIRLAAEGFDVRVAGDGEEALAAYAQAEPDVVVLDRLLPGLNGLEVCRRMQAARPVPVLMLTALGEETDVLVGLGVGADDYMTKPFSIEELLARITATLRRTRPQAPSDMVPQLIVIGELRIDLAKEEVFRQSDRVHLTPTEFALLRELVTNRGKLLTHAHLLRRVWGHGYETETEYVRVYVRRLRAKLEDDGGPPLILTQPRAGYRLASD
jgi:two-component system, OmpR family, KDP operon response regulator KdpE